MEKKAVRKKRRKSKNYLLRIIVFIFICIALHYGMSTSLFDLSEVKVEGNKYYTKEQIAEKSGAKVGKNIFFDIDKGKMEEKLTEDPYIKEVKIRRMLPTSLKITIIERAEAAAVEYGASYFVIDKDGIVLKKMETQPTVPLISGIVIKTAELGKPLEAEENYMLSDTIELINSMEKGEVYFKKIEISSVMIRVYIYDQLVCKGTPEALLANMENGTLQQVLFDLHEQGVERGVISVGSEGYCSFSAEIQ